MKVNLDLTSTAVENLITDEIVSDVGAPVFNIDHDLFFGEEVFEIWTGAGKTGTELTQITDYELTGISNEYSSRAGRNVYSTVLINNPTYQTGDIYLTYQACGDFVDADDRYRVERTVDQYWNLTGAGGFEVYSTDTGANSINLETLGEIQLTSQEGVSIQDDSGAEILISSAGGSSLKSLAGQEAALADTSGTTKVSVNNGKAAITSSDAGIDSTSIQTEGGIDVDAKTGINIQDKNFNTGAGGGITIQTDVDNASGTSGDIELKTTIVTGTSGDIKVDSGSNVTLKDQYLSSPIPLSETGNTGLSGYTATSIVGALNEVAGGGGGGGASSSFYTAKENITIGDIVAVEKESAGVQEKFSVTCLDDVAANLNNTYWTFSTAADDYYVWYNVDSGGTDPTPAGTPIEVAIASNDIAYTVATSTAQAIAIVATETSLAPTGGATFYLEHNAVGTQSVQAVDVDTNFQVYTIIYGSDITIGGEAIIASKDNANKVEVVGVAKASALATAQVEAIKIATLAGVYTGLLPGKPVYLGNDGAITQDENDINQFEYRVYIGSAKSATDIDILIGEPTLNEVYSLDVGDDITKYESMPVGAVVPFLVADSGKIPTGYLDATGGPAVSRVNYWELFEVIGTTYGVGDGLTTFNLPNMNGITITGVGTQTGPEGQTWGDGTKTVGDLLSDQMQGHLHSLTQSDGSTLLKKTPQGTDTVNNSLTDSLGSSDTDWVAGEAIADGANGVPRTGEYTRGPALVIKYLIKARTTALAKEQEYAIDARLTALENLMVFDDKYDTGWIANSDWTFQKLGSTVGASLVHNLNDDMGNLEIKIFINDSESFDDAYNLTHGEGRVYSAASYGVGIRQVDENTIDFVTGENGINLINQSTGGDTTINTQSWYYRIIITKKEGVSALALHQPNVIKDWVDIYSDWTTTSQTLTFLVPDGEYRITMRNSAGSSTYSADVVVRSSVTTANYVWATAYQGNYITATGVWDTGLANYAISEIKRWQDSSALDRNANPLEDGWELAYEDLSNVTAVPMSSLASSLQGTGWYYADISNSATPTGYYGSWLRLQDLSIDSNGSISFNAATALQMNVRYESTTDSFECLYGSSFYVKRIYKFTGKYQLDLTYTNVHLDGNNHRIDSINTDGGTVDATPYEPAPAQGYKWMVKNVGASGNLITGLPHDFILADGQAVEFTYIDNDWTYQNAGLIPLDTIGKDWVALFDDDTATSSTMYYTLSDGIYNFTFRNTGTSDSLSTTITIDNDRNTCVAPYATTLQMVYTPSTSLINSGNATYAIMRIERFQDTTGQDAPSVPLQDGWETLWEDYTATSQTKALSVEDGVYEVQVQNATPYMATANVTVRNAVTVCYSPWDHGYNMHYTTATGTWDTQNASWDIVRIRKYTGQLSINKNFTNISMSGESNEIHEINTNSGDIDGSGYLPASPAEGYKVLLRNSGFSNNNVYNLPKDVMLYDGHSIEFIYVDGEWIYQNVGSYSLADISTGQKDWVLIVDDPDATGASYTYKVADGKYKLMSRNSTETIGYTTEIIIDNSMTSCIGSWTGTGTLTYTTATGVWTTANVAWTPNLIYRWQDSEASDAPRVILNDGWELTWEGSHVGTGSTNIGSLDPGIYRAYGLFGTAADNWYFNISSESVGKVRSTTSGYSAAGSIAYSDPNLSAAHASITIKQIWKFTGLLRIAAEYTTVSLSDGDNQVQAINTDAGDVAVTMPVAPTHGDLYEIWNTGTNGFHITGLPSSILLGDDKGIRFRYVGTTWKFEDVIIDDYTGIYDTTGSYRVKKWAGGSMTINGITPAMNPSTTGLRTENLPESYVGSLPFINVHAYLTGTARSATGEAQDTIYTHTLSSFVIASGRGVTTPFEFWTEGRWKA